MDNGPAFRSQRLSYACAFLEAGVVFYSLQPSDVSKFRKDQWLARRWLSNPRGN
jgi:hypothetical protein